MNSFYANQKVLVTGGASFIGSHLVEELVKLEAQVTVVDDLSSGSLKNLQSVLSEIKFINGDLRDTAVAQSATTNQEQVFHLANIHGGRGYIETHPGEISQNFLIDGNVFRSAKENQVNRVCYTSSACVYPTNLQEANPTLENRYLEERMANAYVQGLANADGIYGWAKLMGETTLKAYNEQFGLQGVSCRLFTVYGPRENESHAIIAFIARALLREDPYVIWGSGNQDRNFTFVDDVVQGILRANQEITDASPINIGTSEITTIKEAVKVVCEIIGFTPNKYYFDLSKPEGVSARAASTTTQKLRLNWEPSTKFIDGIAKTIEWYQEHINLNELRADFEKKLMER